MNFSSNSGVIFQRNSQEYFWQYFGEILRNDSKPNYSVPPKIRIISDLVLRISLSEISWEKFIGKFQELLETKSLIQVPKNSVKLVTNFWEILQNFQRNIPKKVQEFHRKNSGQISQKWDSKTETLIPQKTVKLGTSFWKFLENFRGISQKKLGKTFLPVN